jgi:hypothetical protein
MIEANNTSRIQRYQIEEASLSNQAWNSIYNYQYYFYIILAYFVGFLFITPVGSFNPGVQIPGTYSLIKIDRWDDTAYYMIAKSIIVDKDFDFFNEHLNPKVFLDLSAKGNPIQGARIPIGSSILWSPFIFMGHIVTKLINMITDLELFEDGYSKIYLTFVTIGSSLYTFISLLLSFKILTRFFSRNISLLSLLTVFWGNSLFYYTYVRMLMSHSTEVFTIALFILLYLLVVERGELTDYLLFGLSYGLLVIVRYDNALFLIMPVLDILFSFWSCLRSRRWEQLKVKLRLYFVASIASSVVVLPQFIYFYMQTGALIPPSLGNSLSQTFIDPIRIKDLFFSETRNILWGQPIVIIGAVGSLFFVKQNRLLGSGFLLVILFGISWLFYRPHVFWWGMDFGIRHLIKLSLPLAFGYAALINSINIRGKKIVFVSISFFIILWEYLKIIQIPKVTSILQEGFLTQAAMKVPDLLSKSWPDILMGTQGSYLKVMSTYGLSLKSFNVFDWIYLVFLPLYVLSFCVCLLIAFTFLEKRFKKGSTGKIVVGSSIVFFIGISFLGLNYINKSPEQIYSDFRKGGILAFYSGDESLSAELFGKALRIKPEGDPVINDFLFVINKEIRFPFVQTYPEMYRVLTLASRDSDDMVRSVARKLLEEIEVVREGYFDFGTDPTRRFLGKGWSGNEGSFVWAVGTQSEMDIYTEPKEVEKVLIFRARSYAFDQSLSIDFNGVRLNTIDITRDWHEYEVRIPSYHLRSGKNSLRFNFKRAQAPFEFGEKDTRRLAMAFDWLRLEDSLGSTSENSKSFVAAQKNDLGERVTGGDGRYYDFGTAQARKILGKGWDRDEGPYAELGFPTFVWATGRQSELKIQLESVASYSTLIFRAATYFPKQSVGIVLNGRNIQTIDINPGWYCYDVQIPYNHFKSGKNSIIFNFKHAEAPSESGGRDTRKLAMAFDWLRIE